MDRENGGGTREPLTRDRICEVALEVIDRGGPDAVSMRALAGSLGVKASSLYYHFDSKDALMTGVAEFLYRRLGRPPNGGDWVDQVKGTFLQLREFIQAHPNAAPLLTRGLAHSPVAKKRANVLFKLLCRAGIDEEMSATLMSNLVALLIGHSLLAVWMREEVAIPGSGDGSSAQGYDAPRSWVQKVLSVTPDDTAEFEIGVEQLVERARLSGPAGQDISTEMPSEFDNGYGGSSEGLAAQASFLSGLDALIRGFAEEQPRHSR